MDCEEKSCGEVVDSVTLAPEIYERLLLASQRKGTAVARSHFGNPTPIGVLGFSVSVIPLATSFCTYLRVHSFYFIGKGD